LSIAIEELREGKLEVGFREEAGEMEAADGEDLLNVASAGGAEPTESEDEGAA
jgi:hypothetical protein